MYIRWCCNIVSTFIDLGTPDWFLSPLDINDSLVIWLVAELVDHFFHWFWCSDDSSLPFSSYRIKPRTRFKNWYWVASWRTSEQVKQNKMGFLELLEVASMPIVQVLIISAVGALMATQYFNNLLSAEFRKSLNKVRDGRHVQCFLIHFFL